MNFSKLTQDYLRQNKLYKNISQRTLFNKCYLQNKINLMIILIMKITK